MVDTERQNAPETQADQCVRQTAELAIFAREMAVLQDSLAACKAEAAALKEPSDVLFISPEAAVILKTAKFDSAWYKVTYPDVVALGMDPLDHFRKYGAAMGRSPNSLEKPSITKVE